MPETPPTRPGSGLTKTWHGAPVWVWAVSGGALLILGYRVYKARQGSSSTATATGVPAVPTGTDTGSSAGGGFGGGGGGFPWSGFPTGDTMGGGTTTQPVAPVATTSPGSSTQSPGTTTAGLSTPVGTSPGSGVFSPYADQSTYAVAQQLNATNTPFSATPVTAGLAQGTQFSTVNQGGQPATETVWTAGPSPK